jgi:hypothetical protein
LKMISVSFAMLDSAMSVKLAWMQRFTLCSFNQFEVKTVTDEYDCNPILVWDVIDPRFRPVGAELLREDEGYRDWSVFIPFRLPSNCAIRLTRLWTMSRHVLQSNRTEPLKWYLSLLYFADPGHSKSPRLNNSGCSSNYSDLNIIKHMGKTWFLKNPATVPVRNSSCPISLQ